MTHRLRGPVGLLLLLTLALGAGAAAGGNHVRVVLDTSLSMSRGAGGEPANDPKRLAVLATMLLYDLVDPNPQRPQPQDRDSFVVLPFKADWAPWTDPGQAPPTGTGTPIRATAQDAGARADFLRKLQPDTLPYNGQWTYFSPVLRAALDSLVAESNSAEDRRIIVLVTDGLPEDPVKSREAALLQDLRGQLLSKKVELYVIAFGRIANRERAFFDALFPGQDDRRDRLDPLGGLFVDQNGQTLVLNMARIFSRSFGYTVDANIPGGRSRPLDLDGGVTPPKVAVVALRREGPAPSQAITPQVNAPRGLLSARTEGAAYSVQMIEGVQPGQPYRLNTDTDGADVAILRQVRPELGVLPGFVEHPDGRQAMTQVSQVVAETPFVLRVLARSPTGTEGGQANLDIAFRNHGPRKAGCAYEWSENFAGANQGSRQRFGAGVTYEIRMTFPRNRADPGKVYRGFIDVIANYNGRMVGELACEHAHPVDVYPKIAIRPVPANGLLNPSTLRKAQRGCVRFDLKMEDAELPKLSVLGSPLRLRAQAKPSDPGLPEGALAGATFSLDGEAIGYPGDNTPWYAGRALSQGALLGPHEFCVQAGDPHITESTPDFGLTLDLRLDHTPYDDFRVIEPFEAKLRVTSPYTAPQHFTWDAWWALLLPLLLALAALRWLAARLALPGDLGYRLSTEPPDGDTGGAEAPPLQRLAAPGWWQRLLGVNPLRALRDHAGDRIVGWIKPLDQALFGLKPALGIGVRERGGGAVDLDRGLAQIKVHEDYVLHGNDGRWRLQIGYLQAPAGSGNTPEAVQMAPPTPAPRHFSTEHSTQRSTHR